MLTVYLKFIIIRDAFHLEYATLNVLCILNVMAIRISEASLCGPTKDTFGNADTSKLLGAILIQNVIYDAKLN